MAQCRQDADFVSWWVEVNECFTHCQTDEERFNRVDAEIRTLGFDFFGYACRRLVPFTQKQINIRGSYPAEWLTRYNDRGYGAVDPSIARARDVGLAVWSDHKDLLRSEVFEEARAWDVNVGATFMMRGRDQSLQVLGVARESESISPSEAFVLKLKLRCIAELIEEYCKGLETDAPPISLTEREVEILRWIADGKCSKSISEILNLSEHTVNFHVKSIQRKFGSSNRTLAATYAVALGVL
ncbi:autoinducer binding domain-containing protein [Pseudomonas citronellolis]|uniref:autoinducer binding domain-containing protein n=1 Tax=Pseudomonas citronellolis TaxID=53408 RepID=UPI0022BA525C|nr:autoinducer binding domain-containing protein [Pseudomonas citronellolis]WBG61834.1 LuxR family transcriptional regulator [Pseudomonas citronellolis]